MTRWVLVAAILAGCDEGSESARTAVGTQQTAAVEVVSDPGLPALRSGDLLWWEGPAQGSTTTLRCGQPGAARTLRTEDHEAGYLPRGSARPGVVLWARLPEGRRHGQPGEVRLWTVGEPVTLDDEALWPQRPRLSADGRALWIDLVRREPAQDGRSALALRAQGIDAALAHTLWQAEALWAQIVGWNPEPVILVVQAQGNQLVEAAGAGRVIELGPGVVRDVQAVGTRFRALLTRPGVERGSVIEVGWDDDSPQILQADLPMDASPRTLGGRILLGSSDGAPGERSFPEEIVENSLLARIHSDQAPPRWTLGGTPLGTPGTEISFVGVIP